MDDVPRFTLGDAIEQVMHTALADWRRTYAPSTRSDEVLAGPLLGVRCEIDLRPRGVVDLTIKCYGRRRHQDELYFTKLQRLNDLYLIIP